MSPRHAAEPTDAELGSIRNDAVKLKAVRSRLSDISWWMRLLSQTLAQRANREDGEIGKFWQARYRAVRLLDEAAVLACAAYVDLNPIRAAMAETLERSDHTSVQRRIEALVGRPGDAAEESPEACAASASGSESDAAEVSPEAYAASATGERPSADRFLAPLEIDEKSDPIGSCCRTRQGRHFKLRRAARELLTA